MILYVSEYVLTSMSGGPGDTDIEVSFFIPGVSV